MAFADPLFVELGLIVLFSTIGGLIALRFKQPAVLGLLLVGGIMGPHGVGLIGQSQLIQLFEDLGAVLLLFTIGIQFNIHRLGRLGIVSLLAFIVKMGIAFVFGYETAIFLGLGFLPALYLGAILGITSTAIMIKIAEYTGSIKRKEMPLLISILIFEDIFAVIALTFFSSIQSGGASKLHLLAQFVPPLILIGVSYLVALKLFEALLAWLNIRNAGSTLPLVALSLCFGMSFIAVLLGLTPSIGAFLGGSIVAALKHGEPLKKAVNSFTLSFTAIFFFAMGLGINFAAIQPNLGIIALFVAVTIVGKFAGAALGAYFSGFTGESAAFSGLAMAPVGEFSLIHAKSAAQYGVFPFDIVSVIAATVFATTAIGSQLIKYSAPAYAFFSTVIPAGLRNSTRRISAYTFHVIRQLSPRKEFHGILVKNIDELVINSAFIALIFLARFFALQGSPETVLLFGSEVNFQLLANVLTVLLAAYPLYRIGQKAKSVFDALTEVFIRHHRIRRIEMGLAHDFAYALILLVLGFSVPIIIFALNLPATFQPVALAFFFLSFVFVWDMQKILYHHSRMLKYRKTPTELEAFKEEPE